MRVAGLGFRSTATIASLQNALALANQNGAPIDALATETGKSQTQVFRNFAVILKMPIIAIPKDQLEKYTTPTQSARILEKFATGSLCEAAALAAAGPHATLVAARVVSRDKTATAAIADTKGTHP